MRSIGLTSLAQLTASHGQGSEDGSALRLLALLADNPSPGLSWLFRLVGVERGDVAAGAWDALETQAGRPRVPSTAVIVLGVANVVLSLVVTTLVVINAIGPGSLWELLLIPLVWLGHPRWPSAVPLVIAVPLAIVVTPVSAVVQVATGLVDWLQASAERKQANRADRVRQSPQQPHAASRLGDWRRAACPWRCAKSSASGGSDLSCFVRRPKPTAAKTGLRWVCNADRHDVGTLSQRQTWRMWSARRNAAWGWLRFSCRRQLAVRS